MNQNIKQKVKEYLRKPGSLIMFLLVILGALITISSMIYLVVYILINGIPFINADLFAWEYNSENVSMTPAIINTVIVVALTLLLAVPVGIAAAIYLVEYAKRDSKLVKVIRVTTETLAGIPSIVYGLFGFLAFVIALNWKYSLIAGVLTLVMMVLLRLSEPRKKRCWQCRICTEKAVLDWVQGNCEPYLLSYFRLRYRGFWQVSFWQLEEL